MTLAAVLGVAACSSSSSPNAPASSVRACSAAAAGPLFGVVTGAIQVPAHTGADGRHVDAELLRVDPTSGAVVAGCAGADAVTAVDPGSDVTSHQSVATLAGVSGAVLPALTSAGGSAGRAGGVVDWRTGARTAVRFAGWHIVAVTARGLLLQSDASARAGSAGYVTTATDARDFCVLPSITAPRSRCAAVPGATGTGFPRVRTDGSLGWVPTRLVPAEFGALHGYALTDGRGVVAFGTSPSSIDQPAALDQRYLTSLDGRAVLDAVPNSSAVRWMTVERVDASGVHGTMHTSAVPRTRFLLAGTGNHGFVVSADGRSLHVLDDDVTDPTDRANLTLWTVIEGSRTVGELTIRATAGDALGGASSTLISWPGAAPAA